MGLVAGASMLERERELAGLATMMASARRGSGVAAMIEAEAGIGKTTLLAAGTERASAAGMTVLAARAGELESEFTWGVVRQLFDAPVARASASSRARLLRGAAALARPALGLEAVQDTVDTLYATLHGLYWLTVNIAEDQPLLLAIDDVHWADPSSLRFIAHLLPRIGELPIGLLTASRPLGAEPSPGADLLARIAAEPGITRLTPVALSRAAAGSLVRKQLRGDADEDVCTACHELTGGNPFLLQALLAELDEEGFAEAGVAIEHVHRMTPAAVSASVLLRLARLPKGSVSLARAVAILGADAPFDAARRLAGLTPDEAAEAAGALIRTGILIGTDVLAFVHPLVRSAVYGDLAGPERSRWHYRAARLLGESTDALDHVAAHLVQSVPAHDGWVVEQLRRAARQAWERGAADGAARYLRRALAERPQGEVRGELLYELGQVELTHDPTNAVPDLRQALELSDAPYRRAEIALTLGEALNLLGRGRDAIPVIGAGIDELDDDGPSELLASLEAARLGAARWEPSAQTLRHQLVDALRSRHAGGQRIEPCLYSQLAIEAAAEGKDRQGAVQLARVAVSAVERPTGAATSALPEAMLVLVFADLADEARIMVDEWLAFARARAWPLAVGLGATVATLACLYRGAVSEAVASATGAIITGAQIRLAPVSVAFLVQALVERGDLEAARSELVQGGLDGDLPYTWATTPLLLARGYMHACAGEHGAAISDLLASGARAEAWGVRNPAMHPWRSTAAIPLTQIGDRERAIALADEEVELARLWGAPRAIGVALRAAGIAHGGRRGLELLRQAEDVLERSTAPLEHARTVTDLGAALRRAGHRAEAREHLRNGLHLAQQIGGIHVANRAREELKIAGARPRRDALRGRDALTPSELRVAQLAATGHTNREIAEQLFLTLRTVESHLTSSYSKLDIDSRQQLTTALATRSGSR